MAGERHDTRMCESAFNRQQEPRLSKECADPYLHTYLFVTFGHLTKKSCIFYPEALCASKNVRSIFHQTTRCHFPEDSVHVWPLEP